MRVLGQTEYIALPIWDSVAAEAVHERKPLRYRELTWVHANGFQVREKPQGLS